MLKKILVVKKIMQEKNCLMTELAGLKMKSPVLLSSGTCGSGDELSSFLDLTELGGVVLKGTTLEKRRGNEGVRVAETAAGMLNCIGIENPGVEIFIQTTLKHLEKKFGHQVNFIANISGKTPDEYGELAQILDKESMISAIELNVSCPNVSDGGIAFGTKPQSVAQVVCHARKKTNKPLILKMSPNVSEEDLITIAKTAENSGADCLSLINTLKGMAIDIHTRRPILGNISGGLSGACVKPVALYMVWKVSKAVKIPVIGMGGIYSAKDAIEFFLAGASAISIGTANFRDPGVAKKIIRDLEIYCQENHLKNIQEIVGALQTK